MMGSPTSEPGRYPDEGPQHEVTLTRGYWLGEAPVAQALWVAVMGRNPSRFRGERLDDLQRPVEHVSWADCQEFLERLNAQVAELAARLPTEAEWERACRAGTTGATWIGALSGKEAASGLEAIAWYRSNSGGETRPVGRKVPNPYGLYDMLGNVFEWCDDTFGKYTPAPAVDPVGRQGSHRVIRGGSWGNGARFLRATPRFAYEASFRGDYVGLRLARGPE
jgi:formylglycine-generating enzyme required for sulfatase activity